MDYLPWRAERQTNLHRKVWPRLVKSGYLRRIERGWEITSKGRAAILPTVKRRKEERMPERKTFRYKVERTKDGWAVIDRDKSKIRMHNDVIETFSVREAARVKCQELNGEHDGGAAEA